MANLAAIRAVGNSLVRFLESSYPASLKADYGASFKLISSGELVEEPSFSPALTLYLYRVTISEHLRNARSSGNPLRSTPLPLSLHYLLTAWASTADAEQTMMAWAMRHLHEHPILDVSNLISDAAWEPDEMVQIIPSELSVEDMMRVWDALTPSYRLSYAYTARVVLVGADEESGRRVMATRSTLTSRANDAEPA